jgi:hypothetical protein
LVNTAWSDQGELDQHFLMLHRNFGWRGGRSHRLYALAAVRRQKSQTVIVQRSRPTLMPDDARQPRQIRLETIHSLRYVETHISPPLM